jgi:predicted site-specific integrase-resolvase
MELIKISLVADELGVSVKTVYNWIASGKLTMPEQGYVYRAEAHDVWINQQSARSILSFFQSQGIKRDAYGRFIEKD